MVLFHHRCRVYIPTSVGWKAMAIPIDSPNCVPHHPFIEVCHAAIRSLRTILRPHFPRTSGGARLCGCALLHGDATFSGGCDGWIVTEGLKVVLIFPEDQHGSTSLGNLWEIFSNLVGFPSATPRYLSYWNSEPHSGANNHGDTTTEHYCSSNDQQKNGFSKSK